MSTGSISDSNPVVNSSLPETKSMKKGSAKSLIEVALGSIHTKPIYQVGPKILSLKTDALPYQNIASTMLHNAVAISSENLSEQLAMMSHSELVQELVMALEQHSDEIKHKFWEEIAKLREKENALAKADEMMRLAKKQQYKQLEKLMPEKKVLEEVIATMCRDQNIARKLDDFMRGAA